MFAFLCGPHLPHTGAAGKGNSGYERRAGRGGNSRLRASVSAHVEAMSRGNSPICTAGVKTEQGHYRAIFREVTRLRMGFCETACSLSVFPLIFHDSLAICVCASSPSQFSLSLFLSTAPSLLHFRLCKSFSSFFILCLAHAWPFSIRTHTHTHVSIYMSLYMFIRGFSRYSSKVVIIIAVHIQPTNFF